MFFGQNFVSVSGNSTALRGFTWNNFFLQKTAKHDLSLASITFDPGRPRIKKNQRIGRIEAWRGTEFLNVLLLTEYELSTKNHTRAIFPHQGTS